MKKLFNAALFYLIFGLASGVFYRQFTLANNFTGHTELKVTHVHILALGLLVFLILILFEKEFNISKNKWFNKFFIIYNLGVISSVAMFFWKGIDQVFKINGEPIIAGVTGICHIIITIGLILLFIILKQQIFKGNNETSKIN